MSRNVIREALYPPTRRPASSRRRWFALDIGLVILVGFLALDGTPTGSLVRYAVARLHSDAAELPSLTAWFEHGAVRPPPVHATIDLPEATAIPKGGVPEPYRTAVRVMLSGEETSEPDALAQLDALHASIDEPDRAARVETALVIWSLPEGQFERAARRAEQAGEPEWRRYATLRRYISPGQARRADRAVSETMALGSLLDFQWPTATQWPISSGFGDRTHPTLGTTKFHNGVDIATPVGTPITSAHRGNVAQVGQNKTSGTFVVMDHGHGIRTSYCHLSKTHVTRGQVIGQGHHIADSGNTGRSTGPHLHWTLKVSGQWTDPLRFVAPSPDEGPGA